MDANCWLTLAIFTVSLVALIGFLITKTKGFGRYSTSTLLLILVLMIASLLYSNGKLSDQVLTNLLFAIIGFAGGLFTSKDSTEPNGSRDGSRNMPTQRHDPDGETADVQHRIREA